MRRVEQIGRAGLHPVRRQHLVRGLFGDADETAFAAGQVVGELRSSEEKLMAAAATAFDRFEDAKPFW